VFVSDRRHPDQLETDAGANLTDLSNRFDVGPYLSKHSDIVALMVIEHQTQMQNLITAANFQARIALYHEAAINKALGRAADATSPHTERRFKAIADRLLKYLLFIDEAALSAPIAGTSGFADEFAARGPRDHRGRSLREFDLKTRMFRYPCSYLIYSEAFDSLPDRVRNYLYQRLWSVLTGDDESAELARLTATDRRAILEILVETKPNLPEYWKHRDP
jgi:hypothetical protein